MFPQLEPMRMAGRFVEQYHKNGLKRPEQYLKKLKEERNAGRHTLFVDAIAVSYTHLDVYKRQILRSG